ncbi:AraC family transcriptional regulator [Paraglaciecola aquimarina]|uniref:AraC family transcriptional regulator n=1 Tax=Paraglaciecola algarum TaxID=3050085 RepID=A0ABS9D761_9ALTE|nr:AraC family transcriptional regulator [Paraglaciecola sp. G1-23]MCF2947873.1 AraC family transcriptional regulator [Paraglaciecola sp. G1-23]
MLSIPAETLNYLLMPIVSSQMLLTVIIYISVVRKRIGSEYLLYNCFLASLVFFLLGRSAQSYLMPDIAAWVLYGRVSFLFTLGMPALLIAACKSSGQLISRSWYWLPVVSGLLFSIVYVVLEELFQRHLFIPDTFQLNWPELFGRKHSHIVQSLAAMVLAVLPCSYLLIKELQHKTNPHLIWFIAGGWIYGVLFVYGSLFTENYWVYYLGSIVTALCWAFAVYRDLQGLKSKAMLLQEELLYLVKGGGADLGSEIEKLLVNLETISNGNLAVYKIRIREILDRLTDSSIEAGGDIDSLVVRNSQHSQAIENSSDSQLIRQIAQQEVLQLSNMIQTMPAKRATDMVESAKSYIQSHYQEDIDIDKLAAQLNISRAYLMRTFKQQSGQTINQYLTEWRIELAKQILLSQSVTDTAFAVGYNNSNYFSTVFKKITGKSPIVYKEELSN